MSVGGADRARRAVAHLRERVLDGEELVPRPAGARAHLAVQVVLADRVAEELEVLAVAAGDVAIVVAVQRGEHGDVRVDGVTDRRALLGERAVVLVDHHLGLVAADDVEAEAAHAVAGGDVGLAGDPQRRVRASAPAWGRCCGTASRRTRRRSPGRASSPSCCRSARRPRGRRPAWCRRRRRSPPAPCATSSRRCRSRPARPTPGRGCRCARRCAPGGRSRAACTRCRGRCGSARCGPPPRRARPRAQTTGRGPPGSGARPPTCGGSRGGRRARRAPAPPGTSGSRHPRDAESAAAPRRTRRTSRPDLSTAVGHCTTWSSSPIAAGASMPGPMPCGPRSPRPPTTATWWPWLTSFDAAGLVAGARWQCTVRPPLRYSVRFAIDLEEVEPSRAADGSRDGRHHRPGPHRHRRVRRRAPRSG